MFEYKGTDKFDIGAGCGELEYDFFATDGEEDSLWKLVDHYRHIFRRFDCRFEGHTQEENDGLSPAVREKMTEHDANVCLTLMEEEFVGSRAAGIRRMIVNERKPDGTFLLYSFFFFYLERVNPNDFQNRGEAYMEAGFHNAATTCFTQAIRLAPNRIRSYISRGTSYLEKGKYDKAVDDFTKAIGINPKDASLFSLRSMAYGNQGEAEKSAEDLAKALELDPEDELAKQLLAEGGSERKSGSKT